jgi:hypothetical protein
MVNNKPVKRVLRLGGREFISVKFKVGEEIVKKLYEIKSRSIKKYIW